MCDQRSCGASDDAVEQAILGLLLDDHDQPLWAVDELVREVGDRLATEDALQRLAATGVVNQFGKEFVSVSRTARRTIELWA